MAELIGIIDGLLALRPPFLKRAALLFDKMAVPLNPDVIDYWSKSHPEECQELIWLMERGLVFEPKLPTAETDIDPNLRKEVEQYAATAADYLSKTIGGRNPLDITVHNVSSIFAEMTADPKFYEEEALRVIGNYLLAGETLSRMVGCFLRNDGIKAYPVLHSSLKATTASKASLTEVLEIVLKNIPTPSDQTPWEQIFEYRSDPESRAKFLDLRNWMNEIFHQKLSATEISEKLEYLLSQYERHLRLHKMKSNAGVIETIIVSSGEGLENLLKLKLGKLTKQLFSMRQRKIELLEGELTAPGSEVAYILKTQETFS
jgi:hypothetical protein